MLNRSAINMGKANEHGARLEFQCHCSVVRPMLVLGQAQQPSSDAAWTAAACSSGQARQWGHIVVGPGWWQEGGAATCSRSSSSSSQHAWYGTPMMGMGVYPHCSNVSILMMYLLPYAVILCWIYYISCTPFVTFHYRLLMSNFTFYYLWFTYIWLFKW